MQIGFSLNSEELLLVFNLSCKTRMGIKPHYANFELICTLRSGLTIFIAP